jgi:enterochelin esterase family protein
MGAAAEKLTAAELAARMSTITLLQDAFAQEVLTDIIPLVEHRYRVKASRADRAIAGMAMGGAEALRFAPLHLDTFTYIGVFSEGLQQGIHASTAADFEQRNASFLDNPRQTNAQLRLFWISVGKDDQFNREGAQMLQDMLARHGIQHEFHLIDGGHTWINWRQNLAEFAPLLFKQGGN